MWFDRITGRKIANLPEAIESSRYVAMGPISINGHTLVDSGTLLVEDGTGEFREGQAASLFLQSGHSDDVLVEKDIINKALLAFEDAVVNGSQASFLIPEVLLNRLDLQPFDTFVKAVIDKGHFQEIVRSPNMEMIYQEHLLPIGRVKKFSASAGRHLAAHSECWQKRSFTGVMPRSLLALESEDEYNIYENRVFARLLDHLDRYLQRRCREVARIEEAVTEAVSFEASEDLYFGLTHSVCQLWGEGFKGGEVVTDKTEQGLGTLQVLRSLLREVRVLRSSKLYNTIPKSDDIGFQIRMTNTLSHDQHYRHVARLWHRWLECCNDGRVDPRDEFQSNSHFAEAYCTYVEELVKRSLVELGGEVTMDGFTMPGGRTLTLSNKYNVIKLELESGKLDIVPVYDAVTFGGMSTVVDSPQDIIVITPALVDFHLGETNQTASPLYFYTLEAMVSRLSSWLSLITASIISDQLTKLPNSVISVIKNDYSEYFTLLGSNAVLRKPLGESLSAIHGEFKGAAKDASVSRFLRLLDIYSSRMDALLACPLCGKMANGHAFHPRDGMAFELSGADCGHNWRIDKTKDARRFFVTGPAGDDQPLLPDRTFRNYGRFNYRFALPFESVRK